MLKSEPRLAHLNLVGSSARFGVLPYTRRQPWGERVTLFCLTATEQIAVLSRNQISAGDSMNKIVEKYGLKPVSRPKVRLVRELDLSGLKGKEIVRSKTKLVMQLHKKTFSKLADM